MVASAHESPHRLVVAQGEIVLRDTRLVQIEARLSKFLARVRDLATGHREGVVTAESPLWTNMHIATPRAASRSRERLGSSG